jgi:hypothetical protein
MQFRVYFHNAINSKQYYYKLAIVSEVSLDISSCFIQAMFYLTYLKTCHESCNSVCIIYIFLYSFEDVL